MSAIQPSSDLLAIGRFARLSKLSIKQLRTYDALGLLVPAMTDPRSGYRFYSADQVPRAEVISLLRSLDVPLLDVARLLRDDSPEVVRAVFAGHESQ